MNQWKFWRIQTLISDCLLDFFMFSLIKWRDKKQWYKMRQNRNTLSKAATAADLGNTSLNPRGGVSSFRLLEEEKEQSTLFYLCGPAAQLSLPLSVSAPLPLLLCCVHSSQMRLVLCSGRVCERACECACEVWSSLFRWFFFIPPVALSDSIILQSLHI